MIQPQQTVIIDRGHLRQTLPNRAVGFLRGGFTVALKRGIVSRGEQRNQCGGDSRSALQRIDHGIYGEAHPGLAQVSIESAQPVSLPRGQAGADHQSVERIILRPAVQYGGDRFFNRA